MSRPPPRSTLMYPLFPSTTPFRDRTAGRLCLRHRRAGACRGRPGLAAHRHRHPAMRTHMHRIVLVGAGRIGRIHAANAAASPRIELAGVVDPVASAAAALAEEHATSVTTFEPPMDDPGIAGVVIASRSEEHTSELQSLMR